MSDREISRRGVIKAGVATGVAMAVGGTFATAASAAALEPIMKTIPKSGEKLPAVGTGTNAYGVTSTEELAELKRVLTALPANGVIDTAHVYGTSEAVLGRLISEIGNRDKVFLATKTPMNGDIANTAAVIDGAFSRLQTTKFDLMQIHNMYGLNELFPKFLEAKQAGRFRYVGMSTSMENQYTQMIDSLNTLALDFIQVDYSIGNRNAADRILPLAQEKGVGVIINVPFGGRGRSFFPRVANQQVPQWAAQEFDATTWAQFFLKYIISHPAVTVAIPGTTTMAHLEDNQKGGHGRLPNAAQRKRMEEFWDSLPG